MAVNDYLVLGDVKAYMPNNEVSSTTKWDTLVTELCTNVSREFDSLTLRKPGAYAVTDVVDRYYDGISPFATDFINSLFVSELAAAPTSVAVRPSGATFTPIASTDYFLWPYNAIDDGVPYLRIDLDTENGQTKAWPSTPRSIKVTGKFGYSTTVPADVKEALLLMVVKFVRKAQQNYLEAGTILDSGQLMLGMKIDPDIQVLLVHYRFSRL